MPNMSYCRNENTYHDLQDAIEYITQVAETERDERYRHRLIDLIREAAQMFDDMEAELERM